MSQIEMTELAAQWPREQFEQWQKEGIIALTTTYTEYLQMRCSQAELARRDRIELYGEDLAEVPIEAPPDLSPEDEAALIEAWAYVAKEREQKAAVSASIAA